MEDLKELFKELTRYDKRFRRSQYWGYTIGINISATILFYLVNIIPHPIIRLLSSLVIFIPAIYFYFCIQIKRAHDLGKSGHFVWLGFIPLVNLYPAIMFGFIKGTAGDNTYGPDPRLSY